jgi:hypothetical protein
MDNDSNAVIKSYYLLNDLLYRSETLAQLKENPLQNAERLNLTEESVREDFEFYNI